MKRHPSPCAIPTNAFLLRLWQMALSISSRAMNNIDNLQLRPEFTVR